MKKTFLSILFMAFFAVASFGQNIPNGGFESWTNAGLYEDPTGWFTSNIFSLFGGPVNVTKSTDKAAGDFAMKMDVVDDGDGDPATAFAITSFATIGRPDKVQFQYKYTKGASSDMAAGAVLFTKYNATTQQTDTIGTGEILITSEASTFTLGEMNITWTSGANPDSCLIVFAASADDDSAAIGTSMTIDEVKFFGGVTSVTKVAAAKTVKLYPNPAVNELYIENKGNEINMVISDVTGRVVGNKVLNNGVNAISVSEMKNGVYFYSITHENGTVENGKFQVVK